MLFLKSGNVSPIFFLFSITMIVCCVFTIISQQNSHIEKDKDCAILGFWRIYVVLLSMYMQYVLHNCSTNDLYENL